MKPSEKTLSEEGIIYKSQISIMKKQVWQGRDLVAIIEVVHAGRINMAYMDFFSIT
jgi:hypothetical protein